jgi:hypothetical protein
VCWWASRQWRWRWGSSCSSDLDLLYDKHTLLFDVQLRPRCKIRKSVQSTVTVTRSPDEGGRLVGGPLHCTATALVLY